MSVFGIACVLSTLVGNQAISEKKVDLALIDQLLADYRSYDLPFPPKDAQLAILEPGGIAVVNGVRLRNRHLVFPLEPTSKGSHVLCLSGCQKWRASPGDKITIVPAAPSSASDTTPYWPGNGSFGTDGNLALALQCRDRNWNELADALLKYSLEDKQVGKALRQEPHRVVAHLAWSYWSNQLGDAKSDRAAIAPHLRSLLKGPFGLDTPTNRDLLRDLTATLVPSRATPGSVEALIDALVERSIQGGSYYCADDPATTDPVYWQLWVRGFEVVAPLLNHLDDHRLTRVILPAVMNSSPRHQRVGDVVNMLLSSLARDALESRRADGPESDSRRTVLSKWWESTRATREEAYLLSHVLPKDKDRAKYGFDEHLLRIIAARYPAHLPKLYEMAIQKRPDVPTHLLAALLAKGNSPLAQKVFLFLSAAKSEDERQRLTAVEQLFFLKHSQATALLVDNLKRIPKTPKEVYWHSMAGSWAMMATRTDDPVVWKTLMEVAKRSDVGQRMQMLNTMNYEALQGRQRQRRLEFLSIFLDDREVRDMAVNKERFEGPCAGFVFERLAVRDLAAETIASILDLNCDLDPSWGEQEWGALRERVKDALLKERAGT